MGEDRDIYIKQKQDELRRIVNRIKEAEKRNLEIDAMAFMNILKKGKLAVSNNKLQDENNQLKEENFKLFKVNEKYKKIKKKMIEKITMVGVFIFITTITAWILSVII